jgi:hypothetical protein
MTNHYLSRELVHAWSEEIGADMERQASLHRLLKSQRRLSRFIEENAGQLDPSSGGVCMYLIGVIAALFDRAGGRLKSATWDQVRAAEKRVQGAVSDLLPLDDDLPARARAVAWRAQPHILDEAIMALFEVDASAAEEVSLTPVESLKIYLLLWVATEVLDGNWSPPSTFEGEESYTHVHIDPPKVDDKD